jgi:hypothetical protein
LKHPSTVEPEPDEPAAAGYRQQLEPLPETVQVTGDTVRAWRERGYRISEQRVAAWLYLLARSDLESALYKVVGPIFDGRLVHYRGLRVA